MYTYYNILKKKSSFWFHASNDEIEILIIEGQKV